MRLFKLPSVLSTVHRSDNTWATMSFVVVLPLLPVTATTGIRNPRRWWAANC